ncbi:RNA-guided endonuclease InsQ/TnpB family protein [Thermaerobacter litoralis]
MSAIKRARKGQAATAVRVLRFRLRLRPRQAARCDFLRREAARVWNRCVELDRTWREAGLKLSAWELEKQLKAATARKAGGDFGLAANSTQAVVEAYVEAVERFRRRQGAAQRPPHRQKAHFTVTWKAPEIRFRGGRVALACGRGREPLIVPEFGLSWERVRQVQLVYRHGAYWLHVTLAEPAPSERAEGSAGKAAGGDLGEVHALTLSTGEAHLVLVGRKIRAAWRGYHLTLRRLQKLQVRCPKGSRRWRRLQRAKERALGKILRQIEHLECCVARHAVAWCLEQGVTTLYVGDLDGIEHRAQGRRHRQRMHFWRRSRLLRRLRQLAARHGIEVRVIPERGTSRTCPACGAKRKPSGRVFRCPNGHTAHRDVVGAANILALGLWGELPPGRPMPRQQETTYLRPDRQKAVLAA